MIADFIRKRQDISSPLLDHKTNNWQPAWENKTKTALHSLVDTKGPGEKGTSRILNFPWYN